MQAPWPGAVQGLNLGQGTELYPPEVLALARHSGIWTWLIGLGGVDGEQKLPERVRLTDFPGSQAPQVHEAERPDIRDGPAGLFEELAPQRLLQALAGLAAPAGNQQWAGGGVQHEHLGLTAIRARLEDDRSRGHRL